MGLRRSLLGDNGDAQTNGNANGIDGPTASTSRATSVYPQTSVPKANVTDYLVGTQLDEALANGQDLIVSWPFATGVVSDWTQAEAIWHVPIVFFFLAKAQHMDLWQEIYTVQPTSPPSRAKRVSCPFLYRSRQFEGHSRANMSNLLRTLQRCRICHPRETHGSDVCCQ